ncbi:hypothetical protein G6F70_006425 [Rhizopus microsporus]|uniref:Uncharacterized protein n=1 Tax=Rhizopus azygosporus TaxID=86630 RepID=A0A367K902_RHIAZ|nr:hypothetical protein G6F71_006399 [Rhizopus microsporus]RCH98640.1 hypothetical protein CU097_010616 [Rhizopus azygosporus]KAG1197683.1 hypothetical protein G6F70_006425 [Rhizopus microsporus]KAG1209455.1 hypothetical protein G6F69_006346 [Rhizopus microsporus]KAG1230841.1 hypothetical protein G6F67_006177 [Rhizopus microsporus]
MALFASSKDLKLHENRDNAKLASVNFVASSQVSEALAQSGHLALSAPSQIIGQFQYLKTLNHDNLCEYVEIHRGKHDRLFVVSEYYDYSLQKARGLDSDNPPTVNVPILRQWAYEILSALQFLKENGIIHASLSPSNILLDAKNHIKLFGYGLYYMTNAGKYVDFPIGYPPYLAPECLQGVDGAYYDKRDIWATGIILAEQYTRNPFWTTSDVGLIFDSLITLKEWHDADPGCNIWKHEEIKSLDINKSVLNFLQNPLDDEDAEQFRQFILGCLQVSVAERLDITDALANYFLCESISSKNIWIEGPILASDAVDPDTIDMNDNKQQENIPDMLKRLPISYIYTLWRLAGGDVELDLVKRGIFLSTPAIKRLPRVCMMPDAIEIGDNVMDTAQLYSDAVFVLGFNELYQRLEEGQKAATDKFEWDTDYFMLVDENDVNFLLDESAGDTVNDISEDDDEYKNDLMFVDDIVTPSPIPTALETPRTTNGLSTPTNGIPTPTTPSSSRSLSRTVSMGRSRSASSLSINSTTSTPNQPSGGNSAAPKLPLFLREQDVNYQLYRLSLFSELLRQYPASRREILHHAKVDIPPLLRGKIWAAVLGVQGDLEHAYDQVNKYMNMGADRQIEVDVPRCHQYNQMLASSIGHEKLRRLLKSWVVANPSLVYWQGLDSLCAPFLTLNFNDEAIAFASLQKFIPKFLDNFFLSDNAPVLQEYLAVFRHLLSFHDPELSSHLDAIGFMPDLYAIPWFLTLFTHVFPLDKIYHLWDKLLVGPSSLPLFAGIAILRQIRDTLLTYEFNDCIVLFSDSFPKVDIEKCVQNALNMCKVTPPSITTRVHGLKAEHKKDKENDEDAKKQWWEKSISIEEKKLELAPRLAVKDLEKILPYSLVLDIRPESEFVQGHIPSSMNVQAAQLMSYTNVLKKLNRKYHVVIANEAESNGPSYAAELVKKVFPRVVLLQGGIEAYKSTDSKERVCSCRPQKQTTAGFKGKGSEPPFVMWRCKVPPPLKKK